MPVNLHHRNFLKELDFTGDELRYLIALGGQLKAAKAAGYERPCLTGRNIALIFEKTSTRTRSAFEVAAHDQGAHVTYLGPDESQIGKKESIKDTARVLGRMFDGIEYRGFGQDNVETLGRYAGVPVWNGLTTEWHPTQMLADILTMTEHTVKHLGDIAYCYLGDARNNTARSLLVTGALLGMDVRIAAPPELQPDASLQGIAAKIAEGTGARIAVTDDVTTAVAGTDFIYTDVWVSMGEPASDWDQRIKLLLPYQVNRAVLDATGNPLVKFMHCLPALHNRDTVIGEELHEHTGLEALEVTDDVFESPNSIVFDQAENRLHTIKAIMVATLGR
ncbi:MAG TPA: ornithine carbamoyltransferase [Streptosporangiaceae bacterium]|jgi:ornithine carbamoyltransferase|nr:ornithine carbamoyltransferase [Streptosporangiaceae bacterium]